MRTFFALSLSPEQKLEIAAWRDRHFAALSKPVPIGNYHITLAFLGNIRENDLESLCDDVDRWLADNPMAPMTLRLDQLGYWPHTHSLWIGPKIWPEALDRLATRLKRAGQRLGNAPGKKRFQPHVTLSRQVGTAPPAALSPPNIQLEARGFALYESTQGRQGMHYQALAQWPFEPPLAQLRPRKRASH